MAIPRELMRAVRRLDEYELRRLLIVVRGLLVHADGAPDDEAGLPASLSYRQESVRCGKSSCSTCPHGPYWYAYWKEDGRTRKRYIGRHLPGEELEQVVPEVSATSAEAATDAAGGTGGPVLEAATDAAHRSDMTAARDARLPTGGGYS